MHENAAVFRDGPTLQEGVKKVKAIWPEIMRGIKVCGWLETEHFTFHVIFWLPSYFHAKSLHVMQDFSPGGYTNSVIIVQDRLCACS